MLAKERTYKKRVPTYEIVELFPAQGEWTEQEYLSLYPGFELSLTELFAPE